MNHKQRIKDLAILGGTAAFDQPLHVGGPNTGSRQAFQKRLDDILDRRWLTNAGRYVEEFEQRIAEYVDVKHCIATCNGTVALEIAIRALGLSGEVVVPSFTFVATAHALSWLGVKPIFCDIDPLTYNIDANAVEQLATPDTSGIVGVHIFGRPCDTETLQEIADRCGIALLFDAAHAFGCSYRGHMIGNFGDAEVFSFHATKFLNAFEGGAIVTNDDEIAARVRSMKNFSFAGYDNVTLVGTNGKMSEVSAAMGLTGLESLREFISINLRNYKRYAQELRNVPGVDVMTYDETERNNYQYIVLEIDKSVAGISRDNLVKVMLAENVLARPYFFPCHQMELYRSELHLPVTEALATRTLLLPTGTAMSGEQISRVCQVIRFVVEHGDEITMLLDWASRYDKY